MSNCSVCFCGKIKNIFLDHPNLELCSPVVRGTIAIAVFTLIILLSAVKSVYI